MASLSSKVVGGIFLSADELLRVEKLAVSSDPHFINNITPSDIQHSAATQILGCYRLVSEPGYREPVVMSSASSAVTYTFVYTDSEPGRAFWGDNEEISDRGSPQVIVYRHDRLPMQPTHDPDYVPELVYPEYILLEDEHVFPAKEQPLTLVDSPTAESPRYITESDPKEDPEEYEDDEIKDGPVDYPIDEGDDGDDDKGDSSRDDTDDEDDEEEEEEKEHLALADSTIIVPTDEPASISLPPEAEVERLLAMTTSSPPISLSPPSAGERLARIASTQALIDAVTAALPSPPLPPLSPSLYIPPSVDRRDDVPEYELPPRKRLCLSTLGSRYEIGESSTARPTKGRGDLAEAVPKVAPMTMGEVNTRVTELTKLHERDTHDLYALLEDAQDGRTRMSQRVAMDSQRVDLLIGDRMTL
ncbi:hypothetical protein Tco_1054423 [Tanacetum coccineum]|uniref:Uncharacterized protein n=1 Tax=Tanacetum coccineum TaxID=301880 RepID=A0ABQ5GXY9_9ASTR